MTQAGLSTAPRSRHSVRKKHTSPTSFKGVSTDTRTFSMPLPAEAIPGRRCRPRTPGRSGEPGARPPELGSRRAPTLGLAPSGLCAPPAAWPRWVCGGGRLGGGRRQPQQRRFHPGPSPPAPAPAPPHATRLPQSRPLPRLREVVSASAPRAGGSHGSRPYRAPGPLGDPSPRPRLAASGSFLKTLGTQPRWLRVT